MFARYDTADSTRVRIFGSIYGSATTTTTTVDSPFWSPVSRKKWWWSLERANRLPIFMFTRVYNNNVHPSATTATTFQCFTANGEWSGPGGKTASRTEKQCNPRVQKETMANAWVSGLLPSGVCVIISFYWLNTLLVKYSQYLRGRWTCRVDPGVPKRNSLEPRFRPVRCLNNGLLAQKRTGRTLTAKLQVHVKAWSSWSLKNDFVLWLWCEVFLFFVFCRIIWMPSFSVNLDV